MLERMRMALEKPPLYTKSKGAFWNDEYISKQMLKAHLNPEFEGQAGNWILSNKINRLCTGKCFSGYVTLEQTVIIPLRSDRGNSGIANSAYALFSSPAQI